MSAPARTKRRNTIVALRIIITISQSRTHTHTWPQRDTIHTMHTLGDSVARAHDWECLLLCCHRCFALTSKRIYRSNFSESQKKYRRNDDELVRQPVVTTGHAKFGEKAANQTKEILSIYSTGNRWQREKSWHFVIQLPFIIFYYFIFIFRQLLSASPESKYSNSDIKTRRWIRA